MPEHEGLTYDGDIPLCPTCHAHSTPHCESKSCGWWDCKDQANCRSFFDARRITQRSHR